MLEKWLQGGDLNVMPLKWRISFGRFWMGGLQKYYSHHISVNYWLIFAIKSPQYTNVILLEYR